MDPVDFRGDGGTPEQQFGRLDVGPELSFRSKSEVWTHFGVSLVLLPSLLALVIWMAWPALLHAGIGCLGLGIYCVLAYFLRPRPNHDNLGIAGGLVDHPFRYSDNINRQLVSLVVVLWPGRYLAESLVDGWRLARTGRLPQDRFLSD